MPNSGLPYSVMLCLKKPLTKTSGFKNNFLFHCGGVDDGDLSTGNNGNTIKATSTALTMPAPLIVSSINSASM